eukprot:97141-Ditylum_brightwellii.AAC.1
MAHKVIGEGYMKIPNGEDTYSDIHSWHTPTMPMTVISPGEVVYHQKEFRVSRCDIIMNTQCNNKKAFVLPLIPTSSTSNVNSVQDKVDYMTEDRLQTIWHQRLWHTHTVSNLHHYVDGMPKNKNPTDIDKCDTCLTCKEQKCAEGH